MPEIEYSYAGKTFEGYLAIKESNANKKPCILLFPAWDGVNSYFKKMADDYASQGFAAFVVDLYGKGIRGDMGGDNSHLMNPLLENRSELKNLLLAVFDFVKFLNDIDKENIIAKGVCFGGLCALDLARANPVGLRGAIGIHALLHAPRYDCAQYISASILILHGWEDPLAKDDLLSIVNELTAKNADWQLHAYGHAMHAFTFQGANIPEMGIKYDKKAHRRSITAVKNFIEEVTKALT